MRSSGSANKSGQAKTRNKNKLIKKKTAKAEEPNISWNVEASTLEHWWEKQQAMTVAAVAMVEENEQGQDLLQKYDDHNHFDMGNMRKELERHEA
eukprot:10937241-Heterocapsa_arctica.AAC.1